MIENYWTALPFPFSVFAEERPPSPLDLPMDLERVLEDCAGLAGVVATAAQHPECDEDDVKYAVRVLAEHLHSAVAVWRQWEAMQEPQDATCYRP
jgi:hypothetical protein